MLQHHSQQLVDHLDQTLDGNDSLQVEELISRDKDVAEEWRVLNQAVDAVREGGLFEQVVAVKQEWKKQEAAKTRSVGAVIHTIYRNRARIAAVLLISGAGAVFFKYATISSGSLYEKYYTPYEMNRTRGESSKDAIERAYNAGNWQKVVSLSNTSAEKDNKTYFLAGMADLQLKDYNTAIADFEEVIAVNAHTGSDYFQDEAEYYLAMSWLATKNVNEAMPILERIKADKNHLFHDKVAHMSFVDLRIVQYKENK
jgi:tetratricopeptide (TPR) repeat protein